MAEVTPGGPLWGVRVIEIAGIGPGPFTGMMLADLGADVVRVDRPDHRDARQAHHPANVLRRNRRSVCVDLKHPEARRVVLDLAVSADAIFEPFRPGVAERLGIGPDDCLARNPRLVYGRLTGWGQDGPQAGRAGHDINYIALAGALDPIGHAGGKPVPPLNMLGDFAGGGMLMAFGLVCALLERFRSGRGQVVDAAMVDGAALLTAMVHALRALGSWDDRRGANDIDTGSHFYQVYETADGGHIAVGAIEPAFYREFVTRLGLDPADLPDQRDGAAWPALKTRLAEIFRSRTRDEWCAVFDGHDACVSPVLTPAEAPDHPHNVHRGTFRRIDGVVHPAPAPRFGRTPGEIRRTSPPLGAHTDEVLMDVLGYDPGLVADLRAKGAVA